MKNFFNFKALVLSFVLAIICTLPMRAQNSDDFFSVGDEYGGTRDAITYWTSANGITNNGIGQSEAPVGSGLLILTAVGAGYAISRRKRNFKNGATLLLAFALLLGMTQCKKNVETINPVGNGLHITLRVDGGSRANVTPGDEFATVTFEEGDVIYVGYNNACLGSLTYNAENQKFGGDVAFVPKAADDQPLHFYFLGNKTPTITETTKYTVDIIDQTSEYPVISYNHSNEVYEGEGEYTATLFNYCSIMKFTTNDIAALNSSVLCITGMKNTVTVNFNGNGIEYGSKDGGLIKMPTSGNNERWAIVLPQNALDAGASGTVYTDNGYFKGSRPAIDAIERNEYLKVGEALSLDLDPTLTVNDGSIITATASSINTLRSIFIFTFKDGNTPIGNIRFVRIFSEGNKLQASYNEGTDVATFGPVTISQNTDLPDDFCVGLRFTPTASDPIVFQLIDADGKVYSGSVTAPSVDGYMNGQVYIVSVPVSLYTFTVASGKKVCFSPGDLGVDGGEYSFTEPFVTWGWNATSTSTAKRVWFDYGEISSGLNICGIDWRNLNKLSSGSTNSTQPQEWNNIINRTNMNSGVAPYYRVTVAGHVNCLLLPPDETQASDIGEDITSGTVTDYTKYLGKGFVLLISTGRATYSNSKLFWSLDTEGWYWALWNKMSTNRTYFQWKNDANIPVVGWGSSQFRMRVRLIHDLPSNN
jgi:hypothetical protein